MSYMSVDPIQHSTDHECDAHWINHKNKAYTVQLLSLMMLKLKLKKAISYSGNPNGITSMSMSLELTVNWENAYSSNPMGMESLSRGQAHAIV